MRVNEAKKICPTLQTVHVQTIGGELQLCVLAGLHLAARLVRCPLVTHSRRQLLLLLPSPQLTGRAAAVGVGCR